MTIKRLIIGKHPLDGNYGIWLSVPGIDASLTINPDDFLICPGAKNDMVLMVGQVVSGVPVLFPETLSSKPFVYFWPTNSATVDMYPFPINQVTTSGTCTASVTNSQVTFSDGTGLGLRFNYFVSSRALP